MQDYHDILKQYWGYDEFRSLQGDIIKSVAAGRDTLGLMPTGGGKSLTFQVPAMVMEGICIVVTPLIALMKDQVQNLHRIGIKAAAIYTGMTRDEILLTLDNSVFGAYKFLYVSPERLATKLFMEKVIQMQVCLLAVDESHCISQWGYDFRPSYLRIADVRRLLPEVPVLALTATATPEVVEDIQQRLEFREKNVFRKSFDRPNLAYVVRTAENKEEQLVHILTKVQGSSVVYVRNRKRTKEIADMLNQNGISAEHYHAGLTNATRDARQKRWKANQTRVIVSTNAFGMGIDKADVRTVVHMDLPDSLEAYFQEAGRAGRDEAKAWAIILYNKTDEVKLKKRVADTFPDKEVVRKVYDALGNYYQVAEGFGLEVTFPFELADFCSRFHFPMLIAYNALKILEQAGYLYLTDEQENNSRVFFTVDKETLYQLRPTESQDRLIHLLLRSYTGLFTEPAYISEVLLAKRLEWTTEKLYDVLTGLAKERIVQYIPRRKTPFITYQHERIDASRLYLGKEAYDDRKERYVSRIGSMLNYVADDTLCRSRKLLFYFGEKDTRDCGRCDSCLRNKENGVTDQEFEAMSRRVTALLSEKDFILSQLVKESGYKEQKILKVIRFMMDKGQLIQTSEMKLTLPH